MLIKRALLCFSLSKVFSESGEMNWQKYIHTDPAVLAGKPIVKRTRQSVDFVLSLMAEGWAKRRILKNCQQLSREELQVIRRHRETDHSGRSLSFAQA